MISRIERAQRFFTLQQGSTRLIFLHLCRRRRNLKDTSMTRMEKLPDDLPKTPVDFE
jgi:hypothetical protein